MLATIFTTFNLADAYLVRSRLEAAGFEPSLRNELSALTMEGYTMAAGGIDVQVPTARATEARLFLESPAPAAE